MSLESYFDSFTDRDWGRSDDTETVRFALVGLGWWVQEQAIPAIEDSKFCETSVLVSRSADKAEAVAGGHEGTDGISADAYHAGEYADSYDAVYICTPNATHLDHVESAAAQGKAVLCEKPIEVSSERAERLIEDCDEADILLTWLTGCTLNQRSGEPRNSLRMGSLAIQSKSTAVCPVRSLTSSRTKTSGDSMLIWLAGVR